LFTFSNHIQAGKLVSKNPSLGAWIRSVKVLLYRRWSVEKLHLSQIFHSREILAHA
ncbi:uncharacterized protein METZ01_LOCUS216951, partial [marine metagenome]